MKQFIYIIVGFFFLLLNNSICYSQKKNIDTIGDFSPREKILFDDDFSGNIIDSFPLHWSIIPCDAPIYKNNQYCHVRKIEGHNSLVIIAHDLPFGNIIDNYISPNLYKKDYLPDSFTLQYDFLMGSKDASPVLMFSYEDACFLLPFRFFYSENQGCVFEANIPSDTGSLQNQKEKTELVKLLGTFKWNKWHHFELSFYHQQIKCFLDNKKIWAVRICKCNPYKIILTAMGKDSVAYANFMSRTGKYIIYGEDMNKLLTDKKLVTHAIHFDIDKYIIKSESIDFIKELAVWLKQNQIVKLEIDGHTDNDGNAAANMKLSQDRAREVKKQLVLLGIDSSRLSTKGYGDAKPIQSNATMEGKAENRRVEFIKK